MATAACSHRSSAVSAVRAVVVLGRVLPLQVNMKTDVEPTVVYESVAEVRRIMLNAGSTDC